MGQIIRAKCTECEYSANLFIGGGLSDCKFEAIITPFSDEQKKELTRIRDKGSADFSVQRYPCACNSCGAVFARTEICCALDNNEQIICTSCPQCNSGDSRKLSINDNAECCPECGASIAFSTEGFWD